MTIGQQPLMNQRSACVDEHEIKIPIEMPMLKAVVQHGASVSTPSAR